MYEFVTSKRTQLPTESIRMRSAIVECGRSPHLPASRVAQNSVAIEDSVPFGQIQHRREEGTARAQCGPKLGLQELVAVDIALGQVGDTHCCVRRICRHHAGGPKHLIVQILNPWPSCDFAYNFGQYKITRISIFPLRPRRELQR